MRQLLKRGVPVAVAFTLAALVWVPTALAYQIVYYFGTPSSPVLVSNGLAGSQTSGTAFRLFNEATAKQSGCPGRPCGYMNVASLYYGTVLIGRGTNTYYFIVYQNGTNVKAGCEIYNQWSIGGGNPAYVWCDTTV